MRIEVKYRIEKCDESKCIISVLRAVTICGFDWFSPGIVGGFQSVSTLHSAFAL